MTAVGAREVSVVRVRDGAPETDHDWVAVEEPLEIRLRWGTDGQPRVQRLAVTMRTPGHDPALALGFLAGEGVIADPADVLDVAHTPLQGGRRDPNIVVVRLAEHVQFDVGRLERRVYTTSSCGVCGKASLDAVAVSGAPVLPGGPSLRPDVIHGLPGALRESQAVFEQTGGLHAAALFTPDGGLVRVREDVGRHNAVDKLVGSFLAEGARVPAEHVLLVSGRASFELAQKALMAGVPVLAAVGAPSSLAVDLATEHGMTLLGFVRDGRFNVYAGAGRVERQGA
ncbi:formate dehydrogenase accessory sulfurtransferase FdhD [Rubrivirga sp.]|uniref:formate dehydrogenase accessory sulfurtransferase FdhD n=1 Tax=Rubrivirga sp. TaxID=1885344 RepID=UPI003B51B1C4